jgi:hypothetical protein
MLERRRAVRLTMAPCPPGQMARVSWISTIRTIGLWLDIAWAKDAFDV